MAGERGAPPEVLCRGQEGSEFPEGKHPVTSCQHRKQPALGSSAKLYFLHKKSEHWAKSPLYEHFRSIALSASISYLASNKMTVSIFIYECSFLVIFASFTFGLINVICCFKFLAAELKLSEVPESRHSRAEDRTRACS